MGSKNTSLKVILLATACGLSFAAPASAADMLLKAPPQPIAVVNWSGWYIGALVGYGSQSSYCSSGFDNDTGCNNSSQNSGSQVSRGSGALAGAEIGIDWQNRNFVYGVAADWTWTGMKGRGVIGNSGSASYKAKIDWLASFRGRMGLAVDNTLVYVTAGVAFAGVRHTYFCCFESDTGSARKTAVGWVAGVGVEHRWTRNWSIKGEYLHYDFANYSTHLEVDDVTSASFDHSHTVDVFRIGLTYRP